MWKRSNGIDRFVNTQISKGGTGPEEGMLVPGMAVCVADERQKEASKV